MTHPDWVFERPSPTVVGTRRSSTGMLIGRQLDGDDRQDNGGHKGDVGIGSSQLPGVRVTKEEAAALQSYPTHLAGAGRTAQATGRQRPRPLDEPAHTVTGSRTAAWLNPDRQVDSAEAATLQSYPTHLTARETRMRLEEIMALVPEGGNWHDLPEDILAEAMGGAFTSGGGRTGYFRRLHSQRPSPTIVGSPSQKSTLLWHPIENRPISDEEASALQTYPATLKAESVKASDLIALDLFAGTGWGVACRWLGFEEHGVDNMPEVVATREANGMSTIYNDVWHGLLSSWKTESGVHKTIADLDATVIRVLRSYNLLIGSPPCQTFSQAGAGAGRKALDQVIAAVKEGRYKDPEDLFKLGEETDPRTALVLTPLAYAYRDRPMYVVLEQVPPVLPVWEACAVELRKIGYSVVTGNVQAEQYGVPQTRKRAILIARRDGKEASLPVPTHSKYYNRDPKRLDAGVKPWVSMAEALGWGTTEKPSYTVTGGGTETGGAEPFGNGARAGMSKAIDDGTFQPREVALSSNLHFGRGTVRNADEPSPTITAGKDYNDRGFVLRSNYGTNGDPEARGERDQDQPAPTITSKAGRNKWVARSSQSVAGGPRAERDIDEPAFTVTQNSDRVRFEQREVDQDLGDGTAPPEENFWDDRTTTHYASAMTQNDPLNLRSDNIAGFSPEEYATVNGHERAEDEQWKWRDTPATTIAGDPRITAREHHYHGDQNSTSFRLEQDEAEALQSYPPFKWVGGKGKVYLMIGNAVPPVLAKAILSTLIDE